MTVVIGSSLSTACAERLWRGHGVAVTSVASPSLSSPCSRATWEPPILGEICFKVHKPIVPYASSRGGVRGGGIKSIYRRR